MRLHLSLRTGSRHKTRMAPPLQAHLTSALFHLLCPSLVLAPAGTFEALSQCSSCLLFLVPSLQGKGGKRSANPRSCHEAGLSTRALPGSSSFFLMGSRNHLTQTSHRYCAAVCITLWLSSCFSFENVQWSAATEREGLSLFFPGKSENVEGTGERAQKGL